MKRWGWVGASAVMMASGGCGDDTKVRLPDVPQVERPANVEKPPPPRPGVQHSPEVLPGQAK